MENYELIRKVGKNQLKDIERTAESESKVLTVMVSEVSDDLCRQVIFRNMRYASAKNRMAINVIDTITEGKDADANETSYARTFKRIVEKADTAVATLRFSLSSEEIDEIRYKIIHSLTKGLKREVVRDCSAVMRKYADGLLRKLKSN